MSEDDVVIGADSMKQLTSYFSIGLQYGGSGPSRPQEFLLRG
jgi:hypothetical protein